MESFLWHKRLNYDITAILQIWVNTYVNPAELGTNHSRTPCLSCSSKELVFLHACFKTESTNDFSIFHTTRSTDICTHTLKNKGLYTDHISGCSLYNVYIIVCLEEATWRDEYGHDVIRVLKNFVPEGFFFFWGGGGGKLVSTMDT